MTHRVPIADARKRFASLLRATKDGERIKLTRYNKTVAAIIPKHDLEKLKDCEARDDAPANPKPK
jgi:prevent-host-death family protein